MRAPGDSESKAARLILESVDRGAVEAALVDHEGLSGTSARRAVDKALKRFLWSVEGPFTESEYEARRLVEVDSIYGGPDWC